MESWRSPLALPSKVKRRENQNTAVDYEALIG